MMVREKNRIKNAEIEFKFGTLKRVDLGGDTTVEWAKENIFRSIDQHADALTGAGSVVTIPELRIDVELILEGDFFIERDEMSAVISRQIRNALEKSIIENQKSEIPIAWHNAGIILKFIGHGQLSQFYSEADWNYLVTDFFRELAANEILRTELFGIIGNKDAFNRFFKLSSEENVKELLVNRVEEEDAGILIEASMNLFSRNPEYLYPIEPIDFYYRLYLWVPGKKMPVSGILQKITGEALIPGSIDFRKMKIPGEIKHVFSGALAETDHSKKEKDRIPGDTPGPDEEPPGLLNGGSPVGQAGLVLLAPFLPLFLKNLGYINGGGMITGQNEIPMLLHYLATGETEVPEWKLTLPKVLAGLKPGNHCLTVIKPGIKTDDQIDIILRSVVEHWDKLKKTSPDGLRNTFIIREGTLHMKNGFYFLHVQEQTVDILLAYVPWDYTTIKFDWMKEILFVEWNRSS